jgi:hypothetical protein
VMILENESIVEGTVTRKGDWYHVQGLVGEIVYPAEKVWKVVDTRGEALVQLRKRANLQDADEHLRLAKWCMQYNLPEEALIEAKAVLAMRPQEPYAQLILKTVAVGNAKPVPVAKAVAVVPVQLDAGPAELVSEETLQGFYRKVQPILMNACASCHAANKEIPFKLIHVYGSPNKTATALNLKATLVQLQFDVEKSQLLTKSITAHGAMRAPVFRGKESPAYENLLAWARLAAPEKPAVKVETETPKEVSTPVTPPVKVEADAKLPEKKTVVIDPFDPEEFNRESKAKKK